MNCKNLKIKQKNYKRIFFCNAKRKEIDYHKCCKSCEHYEARGYPKQNRAIKNKKSNKLAKLEKNRASILVSSTKCCICGSTTDLTWHEIFRGKNRANSMKYKLCLRLCYNCHKMYQENKEFNDYWHKQAQIIFNITYPNLDFLEIFKRNYL